MRIPKLLAIFLLAVVHAYAQEQNPPLNQNPSISTETAAVQNASPSLAGFAVRAVEKSKPTFDKLEPLPYDGPRVVNARIDLAQDLRKLNEEAKWEALDSEEIPKRGFQWRPAMVQSGIFLAIQHGYRVTEEKTRRQFKGPFFRDWKESIKNLHGWYDGGRYFTNYVAHPMQGALTARIFINNSSGAKAVEFGRDRSYWSSRVKAFVWALAWSTQFEIGPLSEASLGNVGRKLYDGHKSTLTYVDMIVTPTSGIGWTVGEDVIDKFILKKWIERRVENRLAMKLLRSVLTPTRSFANILRGRAPWRRDDRMN